MFNADLTRNGDIIFSDLSSVYDISPDDGELEPEPMFTSLTNPRFVSVNQDTGDVAITAHLALVLAKRLRSGAWDHKKHKLSGEPWVVCWSSPDHVIYRLDHNEGDALVKYSVSDNKVIWEKPVDGLTSLCVDRNHNVYAAMYADNVVEVYNGSGDVLGTIPSSGYSYRVYAPEALCVDSMDRLYILHHLKDSDDIVVSVWSTEGAFIKELMTINHKSADWGMSIKGDVMMISNMRDIMKYDLTTMIK